MMIQISNEIIWDLYKKVMSFFGVFFCASYRRKAAKSLGAATRYDSLVRSLPIALHVGQS